MLAINHVTLATAAVFAGSLYFDKPFFLPFILLVVVASLLPDIDHPKSEMSQLVPVIGRVFKHRGFTHSLLGLASICIIFFYALHQTEWAIWVFAIVSAMGVYFLHKIIRQRIRDLDTATLGFFSKKQLKLVEFIFSWTLITFLILIVWVGRVEMLRSQVFYLLGLGYALHLVGDFVTKEGIPLFYPAKMRSGLRLFVTGSSVETAIGALLVVANVILVTQFCITYNVFSSDYWSQYGVLVKIGELSGNYTVR